MKDYLLNLFRRVAFIISFNLNIGITENRSDNEFICMSVSGKSPTEKIFESSEIVPDVIPIAPKSFLEVTYPIGVVKAGDELTPTDVKSPPSVSWDADSGAYYTLMFIDADAPSRAEPIRRCWQHWLVGNIPGNSVKSGTVITDYISSGPKPGTDLHRYLFLVYKQNGEQTFDEERLPNTHPNGRASFSAVNFATKYGLGNPIAGVFYLAQWDEYVPVLNKHLGRD